MGKKCDKQKPICRELGHVCLPRGVQSRPWPRSGHMGAAPPAKPLGVSTSGPFGVPEPAVLRHSRSSSESLHSGETWGPGFR